MCLKNLFLAIAYALSAKLAISLSVSPTGISPIWPGAGIALASLYLYGNKVLPGLFVGSILPQLQGFADFSDLNELLYSGLFCLTLTVGSLTQGVIGAWLLKRQLGINNPLIEDKKILQFALLTILGCMVAPSVGSTAFWVVGTVGSSELLQTWCSWWIGDSIGGLIFTPLTLLCFANSKQEWRQRIATVALPIGIIVVLIIWLFNYSTHLEQKRFEFLFDSKVTPLHFALKNELHHLIEVSITLNGFMGHAKHISRDEFKNFAQVLLKQHPNVVALNWIKYVPYPQRPQFESSEFMDIVEKNALGQLVTVKPHPGYYPILYIEPYQNNNNNTALGFDVNSNPLAAIAIRVVKETGHTAISAPLHLVQDVEKIDSYTVYTPLYRNQRLDGITASVFHFQEVINGLLNEFVSDCFYLTVYDQQQLIYSNLPSKIHHNDENPRLKQIRSLKFGNRELTIIYQPSSHFFVSHSSWSVWIILIGGLFFASFMTVTLLMLTGRTLLTKAIVRTRTRQLEKVQIQLKLQNIDLSVALKKAKQATEAKSLFLANMSHELRTPLNAILGFSQLIGLQANLNHKQKEQLQIINSSGQHLLMLINDILDISKIETGHAHLNLLNFNLRQFFDELRSLFQQRCVQKNLVLYFDCPKAIPEYIRADKTKLRQILINLIDNAIKATPSGFIRVTVYYQALTENLLRLYIEVEDSGRGIPEQDLKHIFKNFTQTTVNLDYEEGTGLGLSIVQSFVHLMGGEISVESQVNKGSIFKLTLLMDKASQPKDSLDFYPHNAINVAYCKKYKLLIVDNLLLNRYLLVSLLSPLGFSLKEAENGLQAIEVWRAWQPDIILMDIRMPVMDGYEAIKIIKQSSQTLPTVIIALTASVFMDKQEKIMQAGCDAFIGKPFNAKELFSVISKYIDANCCQQETEEKTNPNYMLTVADFNHLSNNLKQKLMFSLQNIDIETIEEIIYTIAKNDSVLAEKLTHYINTFAYEELLNLLITVG
jgi:signal transduction histidine kinase/CheY-like chemotaxis protein/integral membrane sensor domain MASE1